MALDAAAALLISQLLIRTRKSQIRKWLERAKEGIFQSIKVKSFIVRLCMWQQRERTVGTLRPSCHEGLVHQLQSLFPVAHKVQHLQAIF